MKLILRLCLATALLLLAALSLAQHRHRQAERDRLLAQVRPLASQPGTAALLSSLTSDPNPAAGAARLARGLVAEVLTPKPASPENRASDLARLLLAQSLATGVLSREAASWEALLALGAATYLEWSLTQDNRLFTEVKAWEKPLQRSATLAPGRSEPARFLSLAYLELWRILPPWKRQQALVLLRQGLEDPTTFDRLIEPWLAVSGSTEEALALVPAQPLAWQRLRTLFEERRDWPRLVVAERRFDEALRGDLERRLADTESALAAGDRELARVQVQHLLERMPVDGAYADLLSRALTSLPPGPVDSSSMPVLSSWFFWALDLVALGQKPLPPNVFGRLSHAVAPADPAQAALAALASGDLAEADRVERRVQSAAGSMLSPPEWAAYRLIRAGDEAERGEGARAKATLAAVTSAATRGPLYWLVQAKVAAASSDRAAAAAAQAELGRLAGSAWPPSGWTWTGKTIRRDLLASSPSRGLLLELVAVPAGGAALDVRWNGTTVATAVAAEPAAGTSTWIEVRVAVEPGLARLELEPRAGLVIAPGAVKLLPAAPAP